jgi:N-acyl-D-aspartate/D-glutamate deacylase
MKHIAIKNGTIIDGTGAPPYKGDLVLEEEKITDIGHHLDLPAQMPGIDVSGSIVCPGFIDTHSHSDVSLLVSPDADSALFQGVTTEVIGNCGLTPFPVKESTKNLLESYIIGLGYDKNSFPMDWLDLDSFAAALDKNGSGINTVPLVGHGSIRIAVMGFTAREATPQELDEMKAHLQTALDQGALGLSSGLVYPPGINSPAPELETLCKIVVDRGALYTTHLRGDTLRAGPSFIESLDEALAAARHTGVRLHVSHASPKFPNTGAVRPAIEMMQTARDEGLQVSCDAHPYLAAMTFLASLLPPWAFEGGTTKVIERFNTPAERSKLVEAIRAVFSHLDAGEFWPLNEVVLPDSNAEYHHSRLDVAARKMGLEPAEAMIEILARSGEKLFEVMVMQWIYSEKETRELFCWPHTMVGADGATSCLGCNPGPLSLHPRSWGTFPKIVGDYCKQSSLFSLENMIQRMTGLPAAVMGIGDRGTLAPGKKADIVIFNLNEFKDTATYAHPHQYAEGIEYVWVNGKMVIERGKRTHRRPGKVLKSK